MRLINWIKCKFGKHKYYVIKRYSYDTRKVGCEHCNKMWGMNDSARALLPWDEELQALHEGEWSR